ncbi:sensor histidine kinase [Shouchella clausii]|uniref:sensor histidine kinase n=1 Tax=Shouchella clausii TaxID=79880 RepID=UPI000BA72B96|nr:sensor histidine kinase [Shouchella clausii]PAD91142.1 sensor histidine kinase [Shouchella clausii]
MQNWFHIFPKNTGLSLYVWIIFCVLPFYFVISSATFIEITIGSIMIMLFFTTYRLSFIKKGWTMYMSVAIEMAINIGMTVYFGYIYFALFLAFFIGNVQNRKGFFALYAAHVTTTAAATTIGFYIQNETFIVQFPFIAIALIGVLLLPFTISNRHKRERLESQLETANEKIAQLLIAEERQRIARDLHDTLGQKLSLIGIKSDLARKWLPIDQEKTNIELQEIQKIARTTLNEVREIVSDIKRSRLSDEIERIKEILAAAEVELEIKGEDDALLKKPPLLENVLCMCLKEAVTNIVKHSGADRCTITFAQTPTEFCMEIKDNGHGLSSKADAKQGGLQGMKERLEFINGNLYYESQDGFLLAMRVPIPSKGKKTKDVYND